MERSNKGNTMNTKAAREYMNPSDAQIEEWEKEEARRENEYRNSAIVDYELAILTEQEEDPSWWG